MATLAGNNPTLMDWAKMREPNGGITTDIAEMLTQSNEMLMDMVWREANNATTHRSIIRTGIPTPTWRQYYQGVDPSKSTYAQVDDPIGMMEARSVIDADLAELEGDLNQFRLNEAKGFLEGMNQTMQETVLYGSLAADPKKFNGLSARYADNTTAFSKENIITGLGSDSDNTSIWLIGWSTETIFGVFPKGSQAGLQRTDNGKQEVLDDQSPGRRFTAYEDKFTWKAGLVVRDWRAAVRIANIDVSNLVGESSAADILKLMTKAVHKRPPMYLNAARWAFYANSTVLTMLDIQAQQKTNVYLTMGQEEGQPKVAFRNIPIRRVDQLLNTEATVT